MAQITIYLPEELEEMVRERASKEGTSLSAYIAALMRRALEFETWPTEFRELYGSWEGEFPEIPDLPPETRDDL
jgi:hypothetical protein